MGAFGHLAGQALLRDVRALRGRGGAKLVYELYGLAASEIRIVAGGGHSGA